MRYFTLRRKQKWCENIWLRLRLLIMLIASHTLILVPKQVVMFLIPKTKIVQRIGMNQQRYFFAAVTSIQLMQHNRNQIYQMPRQQTAQSSTTSDDNDINKTAVTTTPEKSEKSSTELETVLAAREARKYVYF